MNLDPLFTATFNGKVPPGWTANGWLIASLDRLTRTDDALQRKLLKGEVDAARKALEAPRRVAKHARRAESEAQDRIWAERFHD